MLLLLVAALLARDHGRSAGARLGALFALGVAAYAVSSAPGFAAQPVWWHAPILALSAGNTFIFWMFARALFDDAFTFRRWHLAVWSVLAALGLVNCYLLLPLYLPEANIVRTVILLAALSFALLAVAHTMSTWKSDLVEGRRRLRIFIIGAAAGYTVVNTLSKLTALPDSSALVSATSAFSLAVITLLIAWALLRVPGAELFPADTVSVQDPKAGTIDRHSTETDNADDAVDAVDHELIAALERLMTEEQVYQQENLTIGALAASLGQPEYKLRRTINQGLGYRNFNVFLNRYRIMDAKSALADPGQANVSVLAIAMDAGFQSLGPFNRAFKAETGITPTEFRRMNLSE